MRNALQNSWEAVATALRVCACLPKIRRLLVCADVCTHSHQRCDISPSTVTPCEMCTSAKKEGRGITVSARAAMATKAACASGDPPWRTNSCVQLEPREEMRFIVARVTAPLKCA